MAETTCLQPELWSTLRRKRVRPPERGEPRKSRFPRANRGAMLDGDYVQDKQADGLAVAYKAQDIPVPSPGSRMPAARWASQDEIAASAAEVESGRSNARGFVAILKKADCVSHAKRTSSAPRAHLRARLGFSRTARPWDDTHGAAGSRRREPTANPALHILDELRDVVQRKP